MTVETTQAQLLEIAQKHKSNRTVASLLSSLASGRVITEQALAATAAVCGSYSKAASSTPGYRIPLETSDLVAQAGKATAAMAHMSADFAMLACVLSELGEDILY